VARPVHQLGTQALQVRSGAQLSHSDWVCWLVFTSWFCHVASQPDNGWPPGATVRHRVSSLALAEMSLDHSGGLSVCPGILAYQRTPTPTGVAGLFENSIMNAC
jgi:hypothetical protein